MFQTLWVFAAEVNDLPAETVHGTPPVRETKPREKDSNLQHLGSEPSVLPVELPLKSKR